MLFLNEKVVLVYGILCSVVIYKLIKCIVYYWKLLTFFKSVPGPPVKTSSEDPTILRSCPEKCWKLYKIWILPFLPFVKVYHPDTIRPLLKKDDICLRNSSYFAVYRRLTINALGASDNERVKERRRLMSPFFNCKSLSSYRIKISNATETMIKTIENKLKVKKRCSVDIVPLLTRLLTEIHLQAFLSFDSEKNPRNVDEFISTQQEWTNLRHLRNKTWYLYPDFVYYMTPYGIKDFLLVRRMRSLAKVWLDSKEQNRNTDDNCDIKNAVINKYGQRVTDADIGLVDASRSILSATSMALFYLAKYPMYQGTIRHEVNDLFDSNEIRTNLQETDFSKLLNTMMFLKEVLRKHPPSTTADRQITEDVQVDGITFPKGTYFQIDIYGLHHNEALWDKPEEFRPERFADAPKPQSTDGFKFLPFMAYSRDCIAKQFSIEEIIIIVAKIVQRFDIECDEHYVMSNETISNVPENGVRVYFKSINVE